jgi:lactoylglutathione lyase
MRVNYTIVFVSDMQRSVVFYRDVLGIPLKFESPEWTEFATDGATLALHASKAPEALARESALGRAGECRAGLSVKNIAEFHARMLEHKVRCFDAPKPVFGVLLAQYADPDGLPFSVSEERRA